MIKINRKYIGITDGFHWNPEKTFPNNNSSFFNFIAKKNPDFKFVAIDWRTMEDDGLVRSFDLDSQKEVKINVSDLDLFHLLYMGPAANQWDTLRNDLDTLESLGVDVINNPETIRYSINKQYILDHQTDLPMIPTISAPSNISLVDLKELAGTTYSIVKPLNGEKGILVKKINDLTEDDMVKYQSLTDTLLLQEFIDTISLGERHLIYMGNRFSHGAMKTPKEGEFKINTGTGSIPSAYAPTKEELDLGFAVREKFRHPLTIYRVDLVSTSNGPKIMEIEAVNPSYHAGTIGVEHVQAERLGQFYRDYFRGDFK